MLKDHLKILINNLKKSPYLGGYTSRDIVKKAITFDNPPRVPYAFNTHASDIFYIINSPMLKMVRNPKKTIGEKYTDNWGITWEVTGRGWDHACGYPLDDLSEKLSSYQFPQFRLDKPDWIAKGMIPLGRRAKKYIIGGNPINMFEQLRSLMGFENAMMAPFISPDPLKELLDKLAGLTCEVIENYQISGGINGFITWEDWGFQSGLQMSLDQFREFYKPAYKKVIDYCHARNIHFIWHCCGDIITLIPEMVDLCVDVVQMDQPRIMGHDKLIEASEGKICFFNCVDTQWSASSDVPIEEVVAETKQMIDTHIEKMPKGGFIIKHYPQPWDIDLPKEKELAIANTFFKKIGVS